MCNEGQDEFVNPGETHGSRYNGLRTQDPFRDVCPGPHQQGADIEISLKVSVRVTEDQEK